VYFSLGFRPAALLLILLSALLCMPAESARAETPANFRRDKLVAWCIVPFDAAKRGPAERSEMLIDLGLKRCAYDWRAEHVPTFEEEILQYKKHGIEFFAFWAMHDDAFRLFQKHDLHPQIWQTLGEGQGSTQDEKVASAAAAMQPLAKRAKELGCKLGLYNHGGWGGEPENMVAVCQRLRAGGFDNIGIVYNFHHGHDHIDDWAESLAAMKPHLLCLNLNGMNRGAQPKILGVGKGEHEVEMIREIIKSGYAGPIGVIDHREQLDARDSLQENLDGLDWVLKEIEKPGSGGPKPTGEPKAFNTTHSHSTSKKDESANVITQAGAYRVAPLTIECQAALNSSTNYNILVASDVKRSPLHWEIFTMPSSGHLTAYLPGFMPDHVRSEAAICDGESHHIAMQYDTARVRLFVDGKRVADQAIERKADSPPADEHSAGLGIGRLVEGGLGCDGHLPWVRISKGMRDIPAEPTDEAERDDQTLGLWKFDAPAAVKSAEPPTNKHSHHGAAPATTSEAAAPIVIPYDEKLVADLLSQADQQGNALRGAAIFAAAKSACLSCHRVGGHGGTVGPELTTIGKQREPRHLVESLFWPKRDVKPEYVLWQVLTADGESLSGFRVESTDKRLVLRELSTGKLRELSRDQVEAEVAASTPMPDGLAAALTRQQQLDLIRFLLELNESTPDQLAKIDGVLAQAQSHGPATFPFVKAPLDATRWTNAGHAVNRSRLYDFYSKQAQYFSAHAPGAHLLIDFPGLDGPEAGHWGIQNEQSWVDDRWNSTTLGSVQAGVFKEGKLTVPRGVCVQLGEQGELAACFNPDTLTYDAVWSGGFVKFSNVRHGFMDGLRPIGSMQVILQARKPSEPFVYHGFYRHGPRVVFAYSIGGVKYLDAPWVQNGQFTREVAPVNKHSLRHLITGGKRQWPQTLETAIHLGPEQPYAIDTIELPYDNPWKALLFCSGHAFLPDGSALVCTMQGDVWRVEGFQHTNEPSRTVRWSRFASGLHHPLGIVIDGEAIYVQCRDQLTRLRDLNADGEADFYECFSSAFETSPAGHDYICGLERDKHGNFYTASGNQGLVRISADGKRADVLATGFRNPDGLGLYPDGTVTVPCSEGEWTPASMICAIGLNISGHSHDASANQPPHFGYRGPQNGQPPALPMAYLPRGVDNSSGGQVFVDSDRWGPLAGQMVHLSFGACSHHLLLRDEVQGQLQGAVVPLAGDFLSGVHRGRFHPHDGQLYVTGMNGWGSYATQDGCFQRVRYTGSAVQLPFGFHVHENGVLLKFSEPLDRSTAENVQSHFAQCWNYRYSAAYGSPEFAPSHPGIRGHDRVTIASTHVLESGNAMFLELPDLQPVNQLHLRIGVAPDQARELFITVHKLDAPFEDFPGYRAQGKTIAAHPLLVDMAANEQQVPNPWRKKLKNAREITVTTGKNLTFATTELRVSAGEPIMLTLHNPDVVPHNWALIRPGTLSTVGDQANRLITDPKALARHYIPRTDDVLAYTDIVHPGERFSIYFHAPKQPGRYPYLCTFPGHWQVMNGVLVVEGADERGKR